MAVITVIFVVPVLNALIFPFDETVATFLLLLTNVTFLFVALDGLIVAYNCLVAPTLKDAVVESNETEITEILN